MKKLISFLRSMKFGIILLALIAACSAVGTLIEQGQEVSYYAANYTSIHGILIKTGLTDIYHSWYFLALLALLCLNLTLCSIVRIKSVVKADKTALETSAVVPALVKLNSDGVAELEKFLADKKCKASSVGESRVYSRRRIGRYGTFITHVAILLTVIFGALALYLPKTTDMTCFPNEYVVAQDGSKIYVDSFRIEDAEGNLDFTSEIRVVKPNGKTSLPTEISVNHPMTFGSLKVYQQTYGTAGSVTARVIDTGVEDVFIMDEVSFLSIDGVNGLWYEAVYPGYVKDEEGNITLITSTQGSYVDPIYEVQLSSEGEYTPVLAFPGDKLEINGIEFEFNAPVEYPGLRIKYTPEIVNALLIAAFSLMIAGLYITFFMPPVLVKTDSTGYTVCGPKTEQLKLELKLLLQDYEAAEEIQEEEKEE